MKKTFLTLFLLSSVACGAYGVHKYSENPSNVWVEDVHYDENLQVIVLHLHAKFLFININKIYGIKVASTVDAKKNVKTTVGENPIIVELIDDSTR